MDIESNYLETAGNYEVCQGGDEDRSIFWSTWVVGEVCLGNSISERNSAGRYEGIRVSVCVSFKEESLDYVYKLMS